MKVKKTSSKQKIEKNQQGWQQCVAVQYFFNAQDGKIAKEVSQSNTHRLLTILWSLRCFKKKKNVKHGFRGFVFCYTYIYGNEITLKNMSLIKRGFDDASNLLGCKHFEPSLLELTQ